MSGTRGGPGLLDLAVLGLLAEEDLHGYELRRRLMGIPGLTESVSFGTLYPALARLEGSGALRALDTPEIAARIPMTGSLAGERAAYHGRSGQRRPGRGRRVYALTDRGREMFARQLEQPWTAAEEERGFVVRVAFARHLGPDARRAMLERRRAALAERLSLDDRTIRAAEPYAAALADRSRATLEADLGWLERLLDAERRPQEPAARERRAGPAVSLRAHRS
ncbi:MAG: PadR family transcriptional regulator [Acidimicrobiales bacterium]